ncbi:MAG: glycosyltransferase family 39 protein [Armatimonadota bacterium]|nr:glycosyltransferase family 39 protein [Armatimonadota bacterium]MDR7549348.1 glycosyltransferase family 39 protein [Armatimonadota bacterium]
MGLALALRLLYLGRDSLWIDEALSVVKARLPWPAFLGYVIRYDPNMPLYYGLLHLWLYLGDSEFAIRLLSVIPAVLTIPVLYALGSRLFGARVGLMSALFLGLNAFHLNHSQEARTYSLLVLLVTLSSLCFVRAVEVPSRRRWVWYAVVSAAAVYSHLFGALVPAAHGMALLFRRFREVPWRSALGSVAAIGLLAAPLGIALLTRDVWALGWYDREPGLLSIVRRFYVLTGGALPLLAYGAAALVATWRAVGAWRGGWGSVRAWRLGVVYTWLVVPVALAFAVSFYSPVFISRYLIVVLPALVLLAAVGVDALPSRQLVAAAVVVFAVASGQSAVTYYREPPLENWRDAARHVLSQAQDQDAVIVYIAEARPAFEYYRDRLRGIGGGPAVVFPSPEFGIGLAPTWTERKPDAILLEEVARRYRRVWLVLSHDGVEGLGRQEASRAIQAVLASRYPSKSETWYEDVRVVLFSKNP